MTRYTDADKLIKKLNFLIIQLTKEENDHFQYVWRHTNVIYLLQKLIEYIDENTQTDVKEVQRGKWEYGYKSQTCSRCKRKGKRSWPYCPYCGSEMDGEEHYEPREETP